MWGWGVPAHLRDPQGFSGELGNSRGSLISEGHAGCSPVLQRAGTTVPGSQPHIRTSLTPACPKESRHSKQRIYWSALAQSPAAKLRLQGCQALGRAGEACAVKSIPASAALQAWVDTGL